VVQSPAALLATGMHHTDLLPRSVLRRRVPFAVTPARVANAHPPPLPPNIATTTALERASVRAVLRASPPVLRPSRAAPAGFVVPPPPSKCNWQAAGSGPLALRPPSAMAFAELAGRAGATVQRSGALSTASTDVGHFNKWWTQFCAFAGTSPWRTGNAANSGTDATGHEVEIRLLVCTFVFIFDHMPLGRVGTSTKRARTPSALGIESRRIAEPSARVSRSQRRVHQLVLHNGEFITRPSKPFALGIEVTTESSSTRPSQRRVHQLVLQNPLPLVSRS
jgi:hypothetical protein